MQQEIQTAHIIDEACLLREGNVPTADRMRDILLAVDWQLIADDEATGPQRINYGARLSTALAGLMLSMTTEDLREALVAGLPDLHAIDGLLAYHHRHTYRDPNSRTLQDRLRNMTPLLGPRLAGYVLEALAPAPAAYIDPEVDARLDDAGTRC